MLVDAKSLALHTLTASENAANRYTTHCVHLEPDGTTVATNGRVIIAVEPAGIKDDDDPSVGEPAEVPAGGVDVPADVVKEVLSKLPRSPQRPALGAALITEASKERVELTTTDLHRTRRVAFEPDPNRTFPDWHRMMIDPSKNEVGSVTLSLEELGRIVKTLKAVCKNDVDVPHVTLHVRGDDTSVVLDGGAGGGRRFVGVLAHVRVKHGAANAWQKRVMSGKRIARKVRKKRKKKEE
jgi:hypothetical protein